jgi:hypothetical protein
MFSILTKLSLLDHLDYLFEKINEKYGVRISYEIFTLLETNSSFYRETEVSKNPYLRRFAKSKIVENTPLVSSIESEKLAIIVQGPIIQKQSFTFNSVKTYLRIFPKALIIVSTWDHENVSDFNSLVTDFPDRLFVVTSQDLDKPGILNVNRQIISTKAGLEFAKTLDAKWSIKTRTDQRITNPLSLVRLASAAKNFGNFETEKGLERIFLVSDNSFFFRLYGMSDMFQFSTTDKLLEFWTVELDDRHIDMVSKEQSSTLREEAKKNLVEVYLTTKYLRKMGETLEYTLADSLKYIFLYFCIMDSENFDIVWPKYTNLSNKWNIQVFPQKFAQISFLDWVSFGKVDSRLNDFEDYLDKSFNI